MLKTQRLVNHFWAEAVSTAFYLLNHCPTMAVPDIKLEEAFPGVKLNVSHLYIFGCSAYAHVLKAEQKKLNVKTIKCLFMGYADDRETYRLYATQGKRLIFSHDIVCDEFMASTQKPYTYPTSNSEGIACL